jgi:hypothetical protein
MLIQYWGRCWDDELNDVGPKSWSTVQPTKYTIKFQRWPNVYLLYGIEF